MENELLKYSIVIPVYNSDKCLDELANRIQNIMHKNYGKSFELILVDDCSSNKNTWITIERLKKKYNWLIAYKLLYNVGQFKALLCGIEKASGQYIINMDDDLQHQPEELPKLINKIKENNELDCVFGIYSAKKHSPIRNLGSFFVRLLNRKKSNSVSVKTSSFRIMRGHFCEAIINYNTSKPQLGPLILELTKKIEYVQVEHSERKFGKSGYSLYALTNHTIDLLVKQNTKPLRFFSIFGFLTSFTSILYVIFLILRWHIGDIKVAGYTSTIVIVSFFGGAIISGIGILGEFIARILDELVKPKTYIIDKSLEE